MKKKTKTLVIFYSRDGATRKTGEEIAKLLEADLCEIESDRYLGIVGYIRASFGAVFNKKPEIKIDKNILNYELIVIGSPNWGGKMACPVRSFISGRELKKTAFFCVQGGSKGEKVILDMEKIAGKPIASIIISKKDFKDNSFLEKINEFCRKLK